jgi:carbonic anhydrase
MDSLGVCDNVIGGHWDCGAISAIATHTCLDHMAAVANWLRLPGQTSQAGSSMPRGLMPWRRTGFTR